MTKHQNRVTKRLEFSAENSPLYYTLEPGQPGQLLIALYVFLRGSLILSAGTASGTSAGENPGGLVSTITVDAIAKGGSKYSDGRLVNCTPRTLLRRRLFDRGAYVNNSAGAVSGAAATTVLDMCIPVQFALPNNAKAAETALKLDEFSQVQLTINTGSVAGMLPGNDRTVNVAGLYFEIVEIREYAPGFYPVGTLYQDDKPIAITQAESRMSLDNTISQREAHVDTLFITETTGKVLADTILNRVTGFTATEQFYDQYNANIKSLQKEFTSAVVDEAFTGLYLVPFVQGMAEDYGLLKGAVGNLGLTIDVSNPGTDRLLVSSRRIFPRATA